MKTKLTLLLLFFCSSLFSETYVCTFNPKNIGETDEIQYTKLKRTGDHFISDYLGQLSKYDILHENEEVLILSNVSKKKGYESVRTFYLNKEKGIYGSTYLSEPVQIGNPPPMYNNGTFTVVE
jgi:hypothetical protein